MPLPGNNPGQVVLRRGMEIDCLCHQAV